MPSPDYLYAYYEHGEMLSSAISRFVETMDPAFAHTNLQELSIDDPYGEEPIRSLAATSVRHEVTFNIWASDDKVSRAGNFLSGRILPNFLHKVIVDFTDQPTGLVVAIQKGKILGVGSSHKNVPSDGESGKTFQTLYARPTSLLGRLFIDNADNYDGQFGGPGRAVREIVEGLNACSDQGIQDRPPIQDAIE